ncbi:2Fe-2S iron-sulfur cluster-binding protein [Paenibacillus sp. 481]|uniref:2Fe-2S iron-sulfur cluster-binding protein n=1 Tax=Paenibacillus sp. 481 TaxID=2835869 RepID=UPI001E37DBB7|nr:2Fe-2S iron-sulfur cluster-binding protein [Paenibacillus sp. 481]UHA72952.1 (2Fe-2S)-binding protein [Paenibacillus sp. 481]
MAEIQLKGRTKEVSVTVPIGSTLLDAALNSDVDWGSACKRGTCARCRCLIDEGETLLNDITEAEWDRMDEEEFVQGYRLACQAVIESDGAIRAVYKPYF